MWSPEEDHIWGALDEGCNSTCHSKAWGELAEDRLRTFGLTFPWIDGSTKSFAGLGSSTKTLGKRNLPFCIQVGEDSLAGAMESHEVDTEALNPLLVSLFAQAKLGLIKDMAQCRCYIGDLEVPMARCTHTGLLLLCLSQFARRSKLPRVVESLRVPSPGTRIAMMLAPSHWHVDGYTWDPNGPIAAQDHVWPDIMIVTAGVKHCFPAGDHRGVSNPDAWRSSLPKAIANRKIILTDTRQLPNPEADRNSSERHCIGRHPGVVDEQLRSGTGMYLLQSTFEAIQKETKLTKQLVVLDFCNANRHRSVAKGTIMSCMLVAKGIEHGLLHLNGMNNWRFMRCGGSCSHCRSVDPGRATNIAERAFRNFLPNANDHDTSDSAYQQRRPLSVSVAPRSATPGPRSTSAIRGPPATFSSAAGSRPPPTSVSHTISIMGPCSTGKTTNKVPTAVKQEEPEVPNKDPKGFQTLKLSAQSSSSVAPEAQKPAVVTGPLTPKAKQMPVRRGDVFQETSIPTQPAYTTGRPVVMPPGPGTSTGPRQPPTHRQAAWSNPLNRLAIRRRTTAGA